MTAEDSTPLSGRPLVTAMPMCAVDVRRDVSFASAIGQPLKMDVYLPAAVRSMRIPAVLIVSGYRDAGFEAAIGCRFKDMVWTKSWGQLFAAAGLATFTYTNEDPAADLPAVVKAISEQADDWLVDGASVGIFATSGHVPVALSALMNDFPFDVRCAALAYGYTLDVDGSSAVSDAAATFRFANPCAGRSLGDYQASVPLLLARAGRDEMPRLNEALDAFVASALRHNIELTLLNHRDGPHAFDLFHDSDRTRTVIATIVRFMADELNP